MAKLTLEIGKELFSRGTDRVRVLKSEKKTIGNFCPSGCGYSTSRPTTGTAAKKAAKINGVMATIDKIFIDKNINAVASEDAAYTEFVSNGTQYKASFDGKDLSYSDSVPNDYMVLAPVVMYAISDASEYTEFKDRFKAAVEEFNSSKNGELTVTTIAGLCDSFYYEVAKDMQEISVFDEE